MAVLQGEEQEEKRTQVGEYISGVLLYGELLPGNWVSRRTVLVLLRRLPGLYPDAATDRLRQLEQRRVGDRDYGQGTGQ